MRCTLTILAPFVLLLPAAAQTPCGLSGVTVTVSPSVAAPGQPVQVTISNASGQLIQLPSSCVFGPVYPSVDCTGTPVLTPVCLAVIVPIPSGQSYSGTWNQNDDFGQQVPDGTYSFGVWYYDATFSATYACCAGMTITGTCGAASSTPRNGSGLNPVSLTGVTPPALGTTWETTLDCSGHSPAVATLYVFSAPASGPVLGAGEVLVGGSHYLTIHRPHTGSVTAFALPIPGDVSLCGLQGYVQGLCTGAPGPGLTNALDVALGT